MAIKKHKPTSPGRRFATWSDRAEVTRSEPEKSLVRGLTKSGGRNSYGRITSRHRGGGAKRKYRVIDFKRTKDGVPAKGAAIELMAKEGDRATLRLPSGEMRMVSIDCRATVGTIGNVEHQNIDIGKAGRNRHKGKRPQTRGTAMNPVDHPHGGGEGSTTPGRHPVTPWGVPTLGYPTRKKRKPSDRWIVRGRRRGKGKR